MADANVYALQIELELDTSIINNTIDDLSQKMVDMQTQLSTVAQNSLKIIEEYVSKIHDGLNSINKVAADELVPNLKLIDDTFKSFSKTSEGLNDNLKDVSKNSQDLTNSFSEAAKSAKAIEKTTSQIGRNTKKTSDDSSDLGDIFDGANKTFKDFNQEWVKLNAYLQHAIKGVEEFRTANYRLSGSMYEMVTAAREIEGTIGDFGNSIEVVRALNAIRVPTDQIADYGVAISEANVYLGINIDIMANQTAILAKSGKTAAQVSEHMSRYAKMMAETGATVEDLNQILGDQVLNLNNLIVLYGGLGDRVEATAQQIQRFAIDYAGMARSVGLNSSEVISDISKSLDPLSPTYFMLRSQMNGMGLTADNLGIAMLRMTENMNKQIAASQAGGDATASTTEALIQATMGQYGLSRSTVMLNLKIRELSKGMDLAKMSIEDYNQLVRKARKEVDPVGLAFEELNAQITKLSRIFAPLTYLFLLASEALTTILKYVNEFIDSVILLYNAMTAASDKEFNNMLSESGELLITLSILLRDAYIGVTEFFKRWGLTNEVLAAAAPWIKFIVGLLVLLAAGFTGIAGVMASVGTAILLLMKIFGFASKSMAKSVSDVAASASEGIGKGIYKLFTYIVAGLKKFTDISVKAIINLIGMSVALLIAAAAMYILVLAVKEMAALGMAGFYALLGLSIGIIALSIALVIAGQAGIAGAIGIAIVTVAVLALAFAVAVVVLSFTALIYATDMLMNSIVKFFMFLLTSGKELLKLLPQFSFEFAKMAFTLLIGAAAIATAGVLLIFGAGLLVIGAAALGGASIAFGLANAGFGYAIGSFEERAASLAVGAANLFVSAVMIEAGSKAIERSVGILKSIVGVGEELEVGIQSIVRFSSNLESAGSGMIAGSFYFTLASQLLGASFNIISSSFAGFKAAADVIEDSVRKFDSAIDLLAITSIKINDLKDNLNSGLAGLEAGIYRMTWISAVFAFGSTALYYSSVIFKTAVDVIYSSSKELIDSSNFISIATNHLGFASDKLRSASRTFTEIVDPLNNASSHIKSAALSLGLAAMIFTPATSLLASGSGSLDVFTNSVNRFAAADIEGFKASATSVKDMFGSFAAIDVNAFSQVARSLNSGVEMLEAPIDRMIILLGRLKDSLSSLGQEISLDASIGKLAEDVSRYATLVENSATRIETALIARAVPAMEAADRNDLKEAIRASTIAPVTINAQTAGSAEVEQDLADISRGILNTLITIMNAVDAQKSPTELVGIFDLLRVYLPELKSTGGNLSSEFNNWS